MEISEIKLIQSISRTGSLSQSCQDLYMSQPTLSKKLARLEHQLNAQLFYRYPKGLMPTDTAKYILSKAPPLLQQFSEIERHIDLMNHLEQGQLNLGVGPIIEQIILPTVLVDFIENTGKTRISVMTEDDETLLRMFANSELDIIVGPFETGAWQQKDIVVLPMIEDDIIAIARTSHPLFRNDNFDEATQYPWIAPKVRGNVKLSQIHSIVETIKLVSDNYNLLKKLVLATDTICAAPRAIFKNEIAAGALREIDMPLSIRWESALLIRPETLVTPLANYVVSLFKQVASQSC